MNRRGFLFGLLAAPALVRVSSLDLLPRGVILPPSAGRGMIGDLIIESTPTGNSVLRQLMEFQDDINKARARAFYTGFDWGSKEMTAIARVQRDRDALKINCIKVF